jgi:hypothetical protein
LKPQVLSGLRFIGSFLYRELKNPWHAGDRPALLHLFTYKQGQNEIVGVQVCFAHEVSQSRRTPQPTRTVHEFSHNATLSVAKVSRKQAGTGVPAYSLNEWDA